MARWPWQRRWPTEPLTTNGHAVDAWPERVVAPPPPTVASNGNLTAAALSLSAVTSGRRALVPQYESWQRELWDYYDSMGEFGYAVTWRSNMISRVRLRAAKRETGADEPAIADSGRPAELVADLNDHVNNQSEMMATLSTMLDIPGEGWLIGETRSDHNRWQIRSNDEIRRSNSGAATQLRPGFQIIDESSSLGTMEWRDLAPESYVVRIWRPHKRFRHLAYSPAKAARGAMRELELVNRHIQAQYLSRLASAGIIIFPDEITFPVSEEFQDEPDPFVREWIETAKRAIETPGTAAAVVPIPIRVPGEYIDRIKHVDFTMKIDEKIIEKRDSARRNLATMINVPTELLFDAGSLNHWGLWQLEESAIKIFISPDVEIMVNGLTNGYLHPMLRAEGVEDWEDWCVWYDASEITTRPDKSANILKAYDRFEVTGKTLRREIGLNEDDAPTDTELETLVLKKLATNPQIGFLAIHELTGMKVPDMTMGQPGPDVVGEHKTDHTSSNNLPNDGGTGGGGGDSTGGGAGSPSTDRSAGDSTGDSSDPTRLADRIKHRDAFALLQARSQHVMEFSVAGWKLKHPLLCQEKLFSCPFTYATRDGVTIHPGTHGDYECFLGTTGAVQLGRRIFPHDGELVSVNGWKHRE
jgi:hypothetical protein